MLRACRKIILASSMESGKRLPWRRDQGGCQAH